MGRPQRRPDRRIGLAGGALWRDALPGFDVGGGYVHREEMQGLVIANDSVRLWVAVRPRVEIL